MSTKRYFGPDPDKTRLRTTVTMLGQEIDLLAPSTAAQPSRVQQVYRALVSQLALGEEPRTRECSRCGTVGMAAATICGNCWTSRTPDVH